MRPQSTQLDEAGSHLCRLWVRPGDTKTKEEERPLENKTKIYGETDRKRRQEKRDGARARRREGHKHFHKKSVREKERERERE